MIIRFFFFFILCCEFFYATAAPIMVTDDLGQTVQLAKPARRVIALAPDITEIIYAIDAAHKLVGVVSRSDYPPAALQLPVVGSYAGLNLEAIIKLKPDLVITWHHAFARQLNVLKKLGIPVYTNHSVKLNDVARTIKNLSKLMGVEKKGEELSRQYLQSLDKLRLQYGMQKRISVYYQIGAYALLSVNQQTWIHEAIAICGGENVFARAKSVTPEVTWESLIKQHPQVIISDASLQLLRERFSSQVILPAVKNQQFYSVQADLIDRAGPRLIQGVTEVCQSIAKARQFYARDL